MSYRRLYVDSNIFIRAFEPKPGDDVAIQLTDIFALAGKTGRTSFHTSELTLAEVLVHPIKRGDVTTETQYLALLSAPSPWLTIERIGPDILRSSARLRAHGRMKLPDAIHAATAIAGECNYILTDDFDFVSTVSTVWPPALPANHDTMSALLGWLRA